MLIHCPTCNTEYDCEPGKYECECGAKFTVLADGTVSPCAPAQEDSAASQQTVTLDIDKTIPPRQHGEGASDIDATIPGKRDRKLDGRFEVGDLILGRYKVLSELGQGGMGVVYECFDEIAGIKVALKALPPELSHNTQEMDDIKENFQLVHNLRHPNIAGYNTLERDQSNGNYYLIMEFVEGEDLRRWMRRKGKEGFLTVEIILPVIRQVAAALDYAHEEKVIHRDIKPGNIMIDATGRVKVLDFGLAAQIHTSMTRVSMAYHGTSGTAPYMAPEQWRGKPQGASADQYALAVMTYEMLAGHLPFESTDAAVLQQAVLTQEADPIKGIPKHAQAAIKRAMNKDATNRFESCGDFASALTGQKVSGVRQKYGKGVWFTLAATIIVILLVGAGYGMYQHLKQKRIAEWKLQEEETSRQTQIAKQPIISFDKEKTIFLPSNAKLEMVRVEAGTFTMSSRDGENNYDEVAHRATLTKDFYIGRTEVTQAQWKAVMGNNPSEVMGDDLPVVCVSWNDAMAFCGMLNSMGKAPSGWKFTLPTETQWEYAAKGGAKSIGFKYSGSNNANEVAWYSADEPQPVGQKEANELGIYDMSGNVLEWCLDDFNGDSSKQKAEFTRSNESGGSVRVCRGGSWGGEARRCRSACRDYRKSDDRIFILGFRLALVPQLSSVNDMDSIENEIIELKESLRIVQDQETEFNRLKEQFAAAKATYWNTNCDGEPEIELRNLISVAAQRVKANIQTLGSVRTSIINKELSYADLDFTVVDEYDKIVRFFAEVEKCTPRLSWRRVEIRLEPTRARAVTGPGAANRTNATAAATTPPAQMFRVTGQIRVIKYTPSESAIATMAAHSDVNDSLTHRPESTSSQPFVTDAHHTGDINKLYEEKLRERDAIRSEFERINRELKSNDGLRMELEGTTALSAGDPELLTKLYDLSLALPEEALITSFRFTDGDCDLGIQTQNRYFDFTQYMRYLPYWRISRTQQRNVSDTIIVLNVFLVKKEVQTQITSGLKPQLEDQIQSIVSLNIFAPERASTAFSTRNRTASGNRYMMLVGTFTLGDSFGAIILERLQGNSPQQLKALQQKEYEQYQTSVTRVPGNTTISANNVFRQYLKVGDTTATGYKLVEVTRTTAVLTKGAERIELTLRPPTEAESFTRQRQKQENNNDTKESNSSNNSNRKNNQQSQTDMTLVGTFMTGDIAGATIILHNQATQVPRNNLNGTINGTGKFATDQEQQLQQALENRTELNELLQTLQQTEGVTEEQTALLRQRLDRADKQIELLQNQQKNKGQDGLSANGSTATANASNSDKHYVRIGETLPNGFMLQAVTRTSATLLRGDEVVELTLQVDSAP